MDVDMGGVIGTPLYADTEARRAVATCSRSCKLQSNNAREIEWVKVTSDVDLHT
jgi:hypothetical protein